MKVGYQSVNASAWWQ
jgi:hypothetical protein